MPINLPTTFPFYSREIDPTHQRHYCSESASFLQPIPVNRFPQFLLKNPGTFNAVWVNNLSTGLWYNATSFFTFTTVTVGADTFRYSNWVDHNGKSVVNVYSSLNGAPAGSMNWETFAGDCAPLQIVLANTSTPVWWSELFYCKPGLTVTNSFLPSDATGCILVEFTDDFVVGEIPYSEFTYAQRVFLPCDVFPPTYEFKEEGEEDGRRVFYATFRSVTKKYEFRALIPEYLCDALATSVIHRTVIITDQNAVTGTVFDIQVEPDWEQDPCLCLFRYTFRRSITHKDNCG